MMFNVFRNVLLKKFEGDRKRQERESKRDYRGRETERETGNVPIQREGEIKKKERQIRGRRK